MKRLKIFGGILSVIMTYLVTIIFLPVLKVEKQPLHQKEINETESRSTFKHDLHIDIDGEAISASIYQPEKSDQPVPCIIMSHGLGATKDMVLEDYALRFIAEGFSVITYDYRHYGESEGKPRQIYNGVKQLEDLKGVIGFAKKSQEIDSRRIYLWGTSAGASYGIIVAAEDNDSAGVISQCGAYDHKEDNKLGIERDGMGHYLKLFMHAQRDKGRSRFGLARHKIPPYGKAGTLAFIRGEGITEGIEKLAMNSKTFRNEICAAFMFMPHAPDVIAESLKVRCPVLIQVCDNDEIVSPKSHMRLMKNLGKYAHVINYPIGHFEIYFDEAFKQAIGDQIKFLIQIGK